MPDPTKVTSSSTGGNSWSSDMARLVPGAIRSVQPINRALGWIGTWADSVHDLLFATTTGLRDKVAALEAFQTSEGTPFGTARYADDSVTSAKIQTFTTAGTGIQTTELGDKVVTEPKLADGAVSYRAHAPLTTAVGYLATDKVITDKRYDAARVTWASKTYAHVVRIDFTVMYDSTASDAVSLYGLVRRCPTTDTRYDSSYASGNPAVDSTHATLIHFGDSCNPTATGMLSGTVFYTVPADTTCDFRLFVRSPSAITLYGATGPDSNRACSITVTEQPADLTTSTW